MRYSRTFLFFYLLISISGLVASQPAYDFGKLKKETLGRSFVAVRESEGMVNLSWRYR